MKITLCESTENSKLYMASTSVPSEETCTNKTTMEMNVEHCDSIEIKTESLEKSNLQLKMCNKISEPGENSLNVKHHRKSDSGSKDTSHERGKRHRHHRKKHSHRRKKGVVFEGERVAYLVGQSETQEQQSEDEESPAKQDDYVLRKLFKKSGKIDHGQSLLEIIFLYLFIYFFFFL